MQTSTQRVAPSLKWPSDHISSWVLSPHHLWTLWHLGVFWSLAFASASSLTSLCLVNLNGPEPLIFTTVVLFTGSHLHSLAFEIYQLTHSLQGSGKSEASNTPALVRGKYFCQGLWMSNFVFSVILQWSVDWSCVTFRAQFLHPFFKENCYVPCAPFALNWVT